MTCLAGKSYLSNRQRLQTSFLMVLSRAFTSVWFIIPIMLLSAGSPSSTDAATIHIWWYATGDDHWEGTATSYDIRYMDSLMTEESFYSHRARRLENVPVPDTSGTYQEVFITGLEQGREYWIGLQSYDEAWGPSGVTIYRRVAQPINSPRIGGWR